jgi:hypothetical protein
VAEEAVESTEDRLRSTTEVLVATGADASGEVLRVDDVEMATLTTSSGEAKAFSAADSFSVTDTLAILALPKNTSTSDRGSVKEVATRCCSVSDTLFSSCASDNRPSRSKADSVLIVSLSVALAALSNGNTSATGASYSCNCDPQVSERN